MLEEAEALKKKGNESFGSGNIQAAVDCYLHGLQLTEALAQESSIQTREVRELRTVLFSNLSMAHLRNGAYRDSWEAAAAAVAIQPEALKAWVRYVDARRLGGYPFEAFVAQLKHVRPLVRWQVESGTLSIAESGNILTAVEAPLFHDLGLSNVADSLELVNYMNGVALVSRAALKPNQVLFEEKQYFTPFEAERGAIEGSTTVEMVQRYAKSLRPHQEKKSEEWEAFKRQMSGAWPRDLKEVSSALMDTVAPPLREIFPDVEESMFSELLHMSLVCRYNGFQSGFFRTCALANHSCCANIAMKYRQSTQTVTMLTVRDIAAGDFLNVKYLSDAHFLMGVGKRREYLHSWLFWCDCDRCRRDTESGAEVEEVCCPSCAHYVVYPFTPNASTVDQDLLDVCQSPCPSCQASLSNWNEVHSPMLNTFLTEITLGGRLSTPAELSNWMRRMITDVQLVRVNPAHWLYRVLLYFYCSSFTQVLPTILVRLQGLSSAAIREGLPPVFQPTGLRESYLPVLRQYAEDNAKPSASNKVTRTQSIFSADVVQAVQEGSDVLNAFVLLWHHISSFYPVYELWAVHKTMCQLTLIHMLYQDSNADWAISSDYAFQLLRRHAKYLGDDDIAELLHFFNVHKSFAVDPKLLPTASKLKKLLR